MKMSITRALSEISTTEKHLERMTVIPLLTVAKDSEAITVTGVEKTKFEKEAGAALQSVNDMMAKLTKLRGAIAISNGVTKVVIGGREMTVVEALSEKKVAELKTTLLRQMQSQLSLVNKQVENANRAADSAMERTTAEMAKATGDKTGKAILDFAEAFKKQNYVKIFDPCKIQEEAQKLSQELTTFEGEVDFVLSESNARTEIEI